MGLSRRKSNRRSRQAQRGRANDGAPPLPPSILRNKTAGPIVKKPGRLVGLIKGAKRAIGKDLRRPLRSPSSPPSGRSKAGKSKTRYVHVDGEAAKSVEGTLETAEETPGTAVRQSVAFLEAIAETSDAPTDDDDDLSRYILSKTSSAPTDDDELSRYILSVSEDSDDLSPIQGDIGAGLSQKHIKPADPIAPSERADSRTDREGVDGVGSDYVKLADRIGIAMSESCDSLTEAAKETHLDRYAQLAATDSYTEATDETRFADEETEETQVVDFFAVFEEVGGTLDEPTDDKLPDDPVPVAPPAVEESRPDETGSLCEDTGLTLESSTMPSRGCGDRNQTDDAPSWGEGAGEAIFRAFGALADYAGTACEGDEFVSFPGNSKKKASIGSLYLGDVKREAREDCAAARTRAGEEESREGRDEFVVYGKGGTEEFRPEEASSLNKKNANWESGTKLCRGCGERDQTDAPSWGEGAGEALFRVLGALADSAGAAFDGEPSKSGTRKDNALKSTKSDKEAGRAMLRVRRALSSR